MLTLHKAWSKAHAVAKAISPHLRWIALFIASLITSSTITGHPLPRTMLEEGFKGLLGGMVVGIGIWALSGRNPTML